MKQKLIFSIILIIPIIGFTQEKIAGQFMSVTETIYIQQQQVAQQDWGGTTSTLIRSYLIIQGKKYKLYRFSKEEIENMKKQFYIQIQKPSMVQQTQLPFIFKYEAYDLPINEKENGKYCLISGKIDHEERIIYNANLIEFFD